MPSIFDIVSELLRFNVSKNRRLITLLSVVFVVFERGGEKDTLSTF